ncbi:MAG: NHL repeat-containing protein [Ignavibacteriales bacterium]|nr:NHL repeat-containing protein [Ignavibacteriales bacterium]MCF8316078.1 NHL repeat-containing protein [Ignavibacteriales bacterium]MCF8436580.1 NHL repeat-containing protein [Ignavibacteriales bacterium]
MNIPPKCNFFFFLRVILMGVLFTVLSLNAQKKNEFEKAAALSVSPAGFIFVCDAGKNEIVKLDLNCNRVMDAGGFGWNNLEFDNPAGIFSDILTIYVADKNNNRIQLLDKDLNYISQFTSSGSGQFSVSFGYPTDVAVSSLGDIYILDSDNLRILKYDSRGNYIRQIGNFDDGRFSLSKPIKLQLNRQNLLFVLSENKIYQFDEFGNGMKIIETGINTTGFAIANRDVIVYNETDIWYFSDDDEATTRKVIFSSDLRIVSAEIVKKSIYILTENQLIIKSLAE